MQQRTIKHVSFSYRVEADDPIRPGEKVVIEKKAAKGETVEIPFEDDVLRGDRFGAFEPVEQKQEEAPVEDEPAAEDEAAVRDMSDDELAAWIKEDRPRVSEVVDSAEGDPEQAKRLLKAEERATGNDPRRGVVEGLGHIIGQP